MKKIKLKFVGDVNNKVFKYSSADIICYRGDIVFATEDKCKQLLNDFPNQWELIDKPKADPMIEALKKNPKEVTVKEMKKWLDDHNIDYDKKLKKADIIKLVMEQ